jgi:hypothetical protein
MRRAAWMVVWSGIWLAAGRLAAAEPSGPLPGCRPPAAMLCGPACSSPPGYTWVWGCCERTPSCADHAWDGYCAEKARRYARWHRCGTYAGAEPTTSSACPACAGGLHVGP